MAAEFNIEVLTPGKELLQAKVTEVVLPAYNGEVGILADHADFVGVIGTGPLKIVRGGDDYWFMVSSGVYQVKDGDLTIFAETAESVDDVVPAQAEARAKELSEIFSTPAKFSPEEYPTQKLEYDREMARLEIHRRTQLT